MKEIILELRNGKEKTPEIKHRRKQLCERRKGFSDIAKQN